MLGPGWETEESEPFRQTGVLPIEANPMVTHYVAMLEMATIPTVPFPIPALDSLPFRRILILLPSKLKIIRNSVGSILGYP